MVCSLSVGVQIPKLSQDGRQLMLLNSPALFLSSLHRATSTPFMASASHIAELLATTGPFFSSLGISNYVGTPTLEVIS